MTSGGFVQRHSSGLDRLLALGASCRAFTGNCFWLLFSSGSGEVC